MIEAHACMQFNRSINKMCIHNILLLAIDHVHKKVWHIIMSSKQMPFLSSKICTDSTQYVNSILIILINWSPRHEISIFKNQMPFQEDFLQIFCCTNWQLSLPQMVVLLYLLETPFWSCNTQSQTFLLDEPAL